MGLMESFRSARAFTWGAMPKEEPIKKQALPLPLTLTKALVDAALFIVNYWIQRRFIFREAPEAVSGKG